MVLTELRNGDGALREGNNILKRNTEWRNPGNGGEGVPKTRTDTNMFYRVSDKPTGDSTSLVLGPKSGPSAPVVRYGADMCEGKSIGFGRAVPICINYPGN